MELEFDMKAAIFQIHSGTSTCNICQPYELCTPTMPTLLLPTSNEVTKEPGKPTNVLAEQQHAFKQPQTHMNTAAEQYKRS
jgi:hypothetical protein